MMNFMNGWIFIPRGNITWYCPKKTWSTFPLLYDGYFIMETTNIGVASSWSQTPLFWFAVCFVPGPDFLSSKLFVSINFALEEHSLTTVLRDFFCLPTVILFIKQKAGTVVGQNKCSLVRCYSEKVANGSLRTLQRTHNVHYSISAWLRHVAVTWATFRWMLTGRENPPTVYQSISDGLGLDEKKFIHMSDFVFYIFLNPSMDCVFSVLKNKVTN